jgi:hypothetical protein
MTVGTYKVERPWALCAQPRPTEKFLGRIGSGTAWAVRRLSGRLNRGNAGRTDVGELTCAFIIRFHYKEDDQRFEWRLKYFKEDVLPRIRAQTEKRFDVCIRCNPAHYGLFENLGCKPFRVKNEYAGYVLSENRTAKYFYDFVRWEDCTDLAQYDIQIGLDSDDLIAPNYVERIKLECGKSKTSLHIYFQPGDYFLKTKTVKPHWEQYKDGSAFFALYYPDKSEYHHCYEISHRLLHTLAAKSIYIPSGYCWMTIHDQNESTGRKFRPEELEGTQPWSDKPW